jgi:hypothetical protein
MLARTRNSLGAPEQEIEATRGFECDVASAESVSRAFSGIKAELGPVDTSQEPSAWSFEVEARPFAESW